MADTMIRGMAANKQVRFFACNSTDTVEKARITHHTSPVVTNALGRLLTGGVLMGAMCKNDTDKLTLRIQCQGPISGMLVTADANGHVKGYVSEPEVMLPANDVAKAVDLGVLSVIKDIGLKEPYVGDTHLVSGEIAEDLTYYFATSDQIPSSVALGVLFNDDTSVANAGGFIIQLMPFTPDEVVDRLEKKITEIDSVTQMLDRGLTPEQILEEILGDFGLEITDTTETRFHCDCSKERVSRALSTLSKKDLDSIIADGESIEVKCQFCNKAYEFSVEELKELRK